MSYEIDCRERRAMPHWLAGAALVLALGFTVPDAALAEQAVPVQLAQAQAPAAKKSAAPQPPANPVEAQLADMKKRLAVTAAQQPQFDAFAQVFRQNADEMTALMDQAQQAAMHNAVEDLRATAKFAQAEADGLKRLLPALEALYASLSDQQKRTADQLFSSAPPEQPTQRKR